MVNELMDKPKSKRIALLFIILFTFFSGCHTKKEFWTKYSKSYVLFYHDLTGVEYIDNLTVPNYYSQGWGTLYPVTGPLQELQPDDLKLLGKGELSFLGIIKFICEPEFEKEHTMTVTLTDDNGKTYKSSCVVTFD